MSVVQHFLFSCAGWPSDGRQTAKANLRNAWQVLRESRVAACRLWTTFKLSFMVTGKVDLGCKPRRKENAVRNVQDVGYSGQPKTD